MFLFVVRLSAMIVIMIFSLALVFCFFFFKQKTAYEMRISDWSSDVCSSDLLYGFCTGVKRSLVRRPRPRLHQCPAPADRRCAGATHPRPSRSRAPGYWARGARRLRPSQDRTSRPRLSAAKHISKERKTRSDERREGKEGLSKCRSRWWPYNEKKKITTKTK